MLTEQSAATRSFERRTRRAAARPAVPCTHKPLRRAPDADDGQMSAAGMEPNVKFQPRARRAFHQRPRPCTWRTAWPTVARFEARFAVGGIAVKIDLVRGASAERPGVPALALSVNPPVRFFVARKEWLWVNSQTPFAANPSVAVSERVAFVWRETEGDSKSASAFPASTYEIVKREYWAWFKSR